jgi:hypothetical protein
LRTDQVLAQLVVNNELLVAEFEVLLLALDTEVSSDDVLAVVDCVCEGVLGANSQSDHASCIELLAYSPELETSLHVQVVKDPGQRKFGYELLGFHH